MSEGQDKDIPSFGTEVADTRLRGKLEAMREAVQKLMGTRGRGGGRAAVRWDDLREGGLLSETGRILPPGGTTTVVVGGGGGGGAPPDEPDLTKPPTPTGLSAVAGLGNVLVEWDAPVYSMGHGHKQTNVYATKQPGDDNTAYTINDAVRVDSAVGPLTVLALPSDLNIKWRLWIRYESNDGVESDPAGGVNGVVVTTGRIGNADLGDLIVEAGNLASGAVTAAKFVSDIEPVTIVTGGSLPTVKSTNTIYWSGKLYRWSGAAYVATVPTVDLTGQITGTQVADGAITTPKIFAGAITAEKIAANTITANEIAANAITASELAADAVTAGKVQAGAITTSKLLVTGSGAALNADPWCLDESAWLSGSGGTITMLTSLTDAPSGSTGIANVASIRGVPISLEFLPVDQGVSYLVEAYAKQLAGAGGACYLGVAWYNAAKQLLSANQPQPTGAGSPAGWSNGTYSYYGLSGQTPPGTWTRYTAAFGPGQARAIPSNARFMRIVALLNLTGVAGVQHAVTGLKISQMASADLIVDGSIIASKLAANAIAVGTAAIENGAINNAMIGNAAIDDAKIANLSAAKLTAGDGTIGGNLKSATYSAVIPDGWIVRPDGFAEFSNAVVRGTVFASAGAIGGSLIGSNYIQSTNWVNLSTGWRWNNDGTGQVGGIAILSDRIQSGNYSENAQGFAWRADGTGQIGGLKVTATGIESSNFVSGSAGLRMNFDGQVEALNLFARGNIEATSIKADAANIVSTLNIAGDAVTVTRQAIWESANPVAGESATGVKAQIPATDFGGGAVVLLMAVTRGIDPHTSFVLHRNGSAYKGFLGFNDQTMQLVRILIDYPGPGVHTYGLTGLQGSASTVSVQLSVLGAKR